MPLATAFTPGTGVGLTDGGMVLGGLALSMIFLLGAFVCFDCIRDLNQTDAELEKQKERQKRGVVQMKSFRGWALLGIVICCVVVKQLHHASQNPVTDELDDMHAKHFAPEQVEGGGGVVEEGAEWVEEHGVYRIKQAKDEVTGDSRTCAYEHQRCHWCARLPLPSRPPAPPDPAPSEIRAARGTCGSATATTGPPGATSRSRSSAMWTSLGRTLRAAR